jgi:leucine-rich repeat protein SHOC2
VRSLGKERALELIGVHKDRLCEYACVQRNFEVLKWAHNELNLPWAQYPPGQHVSDDVLVLRMLRAMCSKLQERWPEAARPEDWEGVTMEDGRVVKLDLMWIGLTGAVPVEIGQLTSLKVLYLGGNQLTSVPAEIWQLTSLRKLHLGGNQLTSVPAEIGQLTSLRELHLGGNQLTGVPAEIGQLTSLRELVLSGNELTSVPAEIGRLTSLRELHLHGNRLLSVPAEIGQLTSLQVLDLSDNELTSVPAAIREFIVHAGLDRGVTFDE